MDDRRLSERLAKLRKDGADQIEIDNAVAEAKRQSIIREIGLIDARIAKLKEEQGTTTINSKEINDLDAKRINLNTQIAELILKQKG